MVDATLIAAPSSTKNQSGQRDPEMHQSKKGNQWHFGMKAHIGVDADSGLVHTVVGTAANVNDVTQAGALVHGEEQDVFADAGYQGVAKREEVQSIHANWHVAMRRGKRRALDKNRPMDACWTRLNTSRHVSAPRWVSSHQTTVRLRQCEIPGAGQEHGQSDDVVCVEQLVDGAAQAAARAAGVRAPEIGQKAFDKGNMP